MVGIGNYMTGMNTIITPTTNRSVVRPPAALHARAGTLNSPYLPRLQIVPDHAERMHPACAPHALRIRNAMPLNLILILILILIKRA